MGFVKDAVEDVVGGLTGRTAAEASRRAAQTAAQSQSEALDYLKEREAIPVEIRDMALRGLQDVYLGGGRQDLLDDIQADPFYQSQVEQAEQAALRGASASGLLRSGVVPQTLSRIAPQILREAYQERLGGLRGLAGLQDNSSQIASTISGIGQTQTQGMLGAAQAQQQGVGNLLQLGGMAALAFSDPSLKDNVRIVGEYKGLPWCEWVWNKKASEVGLTGPGCGVMADDVKDKYPHLIHECSGYMMVDYEGLHNG